MPMPDAIRPQRVVVMGPESTGKTTLARLLARHFGVACVPEEARLFYEEAGHAHYVYEDEALITERHVQRVAQTERLARDTGQPFLVLDTDVLTIGFWSQHYFGRQPPNLQAAIAGWQAELYLLLATDRPWQPDSQRDRPHSRHSFLQQQQALLRQRGATYRLITGDWPARFRQATEAIDETLLR